MDVWTYNDWNLACVIVLAAAIATTSATFLLAFKHVKVGESAVQYITYSICRLYLIYSLAHLLLHVSILANFDGLQNALGNRKLSSTAYSEGKILRSLVVTVILIGDCALLCTAFFVTMLAYEMKRLIIKSMDRGPKNESATIRRYCLCAYGGAMCFAILVAISAFLSYSNAEPLQSIACWILLTGIWVSVLYPVYATIYISIQKRARDPALLVLHRRIKIFVVVYCVLVFPYCIVQVLSRTFDDPMMNYIGFTQVMHYLSGAGTAVAIGINVTCCYRALRPLMPDSVYEQLLERGYFIGELNLATMNVIVEAPIRPIFVVTDIEGSSRLWSGSPQTMGEAQSIHDDLLRQQLPRYRGYEVTTAGDSFQLAFHSVREAIEWCVSVQEKLLKAQWPTGLLKHENAARVCDVWTRLLFNGLRVRMAIHNGDMRLVCSRHPTTGKMTYLGLSEMVAREMSEMGQGGQIVISETALAVYKDELLQTSSVECGGKIEEIFIIQPFCIKFERPEWNISLQMHEVIPSRIGDRFGSHVDRRCKRLRFLPFFGATTRPGRGDRQVTICEEISNV